MWPFPVRLLGYSWIFVCFLLVAANGQKDKCDALTKDIVLTNDPGVCDYNSVLLGHSTNFVTLNFSNAENKPLNDFLRQNFDTISGAIVMEGNNLVDTVNYAKIGTWNGQRVPANRIFISIRNNPKLTKIEWGLKVKQLVIIPGQEDVHVFLYNNPLLDSTSIKRIDDAVSSHKNIKKHIQSVPGECIFQDPFDPAKYTPPAPELLEHCKSIKGDLILADGTVKNSLKLDDNACLKLTGVNMKGVTITATKGGGLADCKDGKTKSEIRDNKHLCGDELQKLADYFPTTLNVSVQMDAKTCTVTCNAPTDVFHEYNYCHEISIDVSIAGWFTDANLKEKLGQLVASDHQVIIERGSMKTITMEKLQRVKHLKIADNSQLKDLNLPALTNVTELVITGSPDLPFTKIAQLNINPATSTVECHTTTTDVITNIDNLRLCSTIIGPLILDGLKKDVAKFNVKRIKGCVTIKNTKLTSLAFLNIEITDCAKGHTATDNPELCKADYFSDKNKVPIAFTGKYKECGKHCSTLNKVGCETFGGELVFSATVQHDYEKLKTLKTIRGKLTIDNTPLAGIDIPNLEEIQGTTAPALQVTNNSKLESLSMKKLKKISVADGTVPIVKILDNPRLKQEVLTQFLPSALYDECVKKGTNCQYLDSFPGAHEEGISMEAIVGGVVGALVLIVVLVIVAACCHRRQKKKRIRKLATDNTTVDCADDDDKVVDEKMPGGKEWKELTSEDCFYYIILGIDRHKKNKKLAHNVCDDLPDMALEMLYTIATSLVVDHFLYWRCLFKGIPDMDDEDGQSKKKLQPALISDKMLLNKNVHYVNAKYRDRLADFIQALVEAEAKSEELTKKKPVHIFHVGARFEGIIGKIGEAHTNEQEGKEKAKESGGSTGTTTSTTNQIDDKQKSATKKAENGSVLKLYKYNRVNLLKENDYCLHELTGALKFVDKNGKKHRTEIVVLEIIPFISNKIKERKEKANKEWSSIPNHLFCSMTSAAEIPWPAIVKYALERNIIIHVDEADYYLLVYYFIATFEALSGVYGPHDPEKFKYFAHGIYRKYVCKLYKNEFNSGAVNAWCIWAKAMCLWFEGIKMKCHDQEKAGDKEATKGYTKDITQLYTSYDMDRMCKNMITRTDGKKGPQEMVCDLARMELFMCHHGPIQWSKFFDKTKNLPADSKHPLVSFIEKRDTFATVKNKGIDYDPLKPWLGFKGQEAIAKNGKNTGTRIIWATQKQDKTGAGEAVGGESIRPLFITL